jgi:hypothetical protein
MRRLGSSGGILGNLRKPPRNLQKTSEKPLGNLNTGFREVAQKSNNLQETSGKPKHRFPDSFLSVAQKKTTFQKPLGNLNTGFH